MTTHLRVANCTLCVPQSQMADYRKAYPDLPLLVHPDEVVGLPAKRQWCLENAGDQIQLDDDMLGVYRVYRRPGSWKRAVLSPKRAYDLIQVTAETARAMGCYLFGFGKHAHPLTFNGLRPFRMGGYSPGGAMGMLEGSRLWFPKDTTLPLDDYWVCLLNAYYHRFAFYDFRFSCGFGETYVNPGGMSEFRSKVDGKEPEVAATEYLRKHFGTAIRDSRYTQRNVTRRVRNPGRRQIVMPYQT